MRKILALLLCALLVLGSFAGCAKEKEPYVPTGDALEDENADLNETVPREEQDLTLVYNSDRSLHPYECTDYTNRTVLSLVYQSLFVVDDDYDVHPMLCKEYSVSDDLTTYTIYLQNATFSDGTPLTAAHVLESYNLAMDSDVYGARFHQVWDIEQTGNNAITFHLNTPYENFPILLDVPIIKAEAKPEPVRTDTDNEDEDEDGDEETTEPTVPETTAATQPEEEAGLPLGTGPYYFDETNAGMRLRRTVNWWCGADIPVNASSVTLVEAGSPIDVRDAFQFGDVGLVCADPGSDSYADFRCDYELWDIESGIFLYIGFNMESEFFQDQALRSALTYAIDRELLVEEYYRGYADAATLPASPKSPYYDEALASQYTYDSDKFSQAVTKAGLQGKEIILLANSSDSVRLRVAKEIEEMLEKCGLQVTIQEYDGDYASAIAYRGYDIYIAETRLSPNMDLTPFFYIYGSLSYGALDNEAAYAYCLKALENQGNYYNLHKLVMDQGLLCPILFRNYAVYAIRGQMTGLTPTRDNVFYYDLGTDLADIQIYEDEETTEE